MFQRFSVHAALLDLDGTMFGYERFLERYEHQFQDYFRLLVQKSLQLFIKTLQKWVSFGYGFCRYMLAAALWKARSTAL